MKKLIFTILFLVFNLPIYSQVTQEWVQRYAGYGIGDNYGIPTSIAVDGSGNIDVAG